MKKKFKAPRKTDKDIFLAKLLKDANFDTGFYQIPFIKNIKVSRPKDLIAWSQRKRCNNKDKCALMFYEFDGNFDDIDGIYYILKFGTNKEIIELVDELKEFAFVICPDYSVYGNFPNYKQIDAIARSREVGYILSTFGIKVVVNYRATYEWSYELALSGIEKRQIVAIGTLGAIRDNDSKKLLKNSIDALVENIEPTVIIVYGKAPKEIFKSAIDKNIEIWQFDSIISRAFNGE